MAEAITWMLSVVVLALICSCIYILMGKGRGAKAATSKIARLQGQVDDLEFKQQLLSELEDTALVVLDSASQVLIANRAAKTFFAHENPIGVAYRDFMQTPEILAVVDDALQSAQRTRAEVHLKSDGDKGDQFISVDVKFLSDSTRGEYTRIRIQDVTERRLNEMIQKDFVANASHELRTPLAIINGYVETMMDDEVLSDVDTSQHFLKIMQRHGKRLARIIEEMLMITKLESGGHNPLKLESFRVRDCIEDCLSHLDHLITESKAQITIEMSDEDLRIEADQFYLSQILFNLVENAIKQNPQMLISLEVGAEKSKDGTNIKMWVRDNGKGIPAVDIPFIFRRFYRVAKDHSQQEIKGTGLGLSIVKRAAEAHNGTIECQSIQGEATTFTLTIPC